MLVRMSEVAPAPTERSTADEWVDHRFRPDIEGLRAVAVLVVMLFHAGIAGFAGGYVGVDVFFVVSGFLITTLLVRDFTGTGSISLLQFYARRVRRLLPASVLVLAATALLARLFMAPLAYVLAARDLPFAALYVSNLRFARRAMDYFAADNPTLVLHYWSLAVEEQFYVVWPVLLLVAARLAQRRGVVVALSFVTVASFAVGVVLTEVKQPWAFFFLPARAWELAVGGLVALGGSRLARLPQSARSVGGIVGMLAIAASVLAFDDDTAFPGWIAAAPVLGTAMIIVAGMGSDGTGVSRMLSTPPLVRIGRWSYSLYLWHWPLLVLLDGDGRGKPSVALRLGALAASVVLAALTFRFIEAPARSAPSLVGSPRRCIALGVALTAVAVAVSVGAMASDPRLDSGRLAVAAPPEGLDYVPSDMRPSLLRATKDLPRIYSTGCHDIGVAAALDRCVFGDVGAPRTMVLLGDSHAAQWFPALETIASEHGWELRTLTRPACPAPDVVVESRRLKRRDTECEQWRRRALARIAEIDDVLVVMSSSRDYKTPDGEDIDAGWAAGVARTVAAIGEGARVVIIGDTPRPSFDVPRCLSAHLEDALACAPEPAVVVDDDHREIEARSAEDAGAVFVDPTRWVCPGSPCRVIAGNILVYRDRDHITTTFAASLSDELARALPVGG